MEWVGMRVLSDMPSVPVYKAQLRVGSDLGFSRQVGLAPALPWGLTEHPLPWDTDGNISWGREVCC